MIFATFWEIRNLSQPFRNLFATFGPKIDQFFKDFTKIKTPRIWKKDKFNKKKIAWEKYFTIHPKTKVTLDLDYFAIWGDATFPRED